MKKLVAIVLSILIVIGLSGCSNKSLLKEGVAPYKLSENNQALLQFLGMEKNVNLISFKAPKAAKTLKIQSYVLDDRGQWEAVSNFMVSLGEEESSDARLEGTFAMLIHDDDSIDMNITTTMGQYSSKVKPPDKEYDFSISYQGFLEDFKKIELNKEIPVALLAHNSGSSMRF